MEAKTAKLLPLLEKIAKENNFKTYDIKVTPISTGGANYTSLLYLVNISGDGHDDLRLFVKIGATGEKMRGQVHGDLYDNERFIYTNLMVAYKQLEDRHNVPEKHRLRFPKYYGADATYLHEILALEDLSCQGFILHDRRKPVDWEYASAAITQLAKYHALCLAYAHENPKEFEDVLSRCAPSLLKESEGIHAYYDTLVKTALAAVRVEHRDLLKTFLDRHNMTEFNNYAKTYRQAVILHGDFRPSNTLYKPRKDGTVEMVIIDYQALIYGSPVIDLLYFIFLSSDGSARAQFYDKLVAHYHSELGSALHRLGLQAEDVFPEDEFRLELKEKLPYGLLLSALYLPTILQSDEDALEVSAELDMTSFSTSATSDLHKQRLNEAVEDFIAWGILK